ncbi:hypothetical protein SAMN02745121_01479 [Nannocystis exedens]|uniref:Lipoprotein n=1 Tax=Nannocystis exedens TaxID=54 RepID=A0A1I1V475_9BACT|nr:hypothetical protein [Nannocystis exedens]PCC72277.1 hypothetical protein NAEX_05356 [Nannocystis exedens]SFD76818.1 hypothetical protein SAMN02745121_01479 [Nannocystis exedens]
MTIASRTYRLNLRSLRLCALALPCALLATACDDPDQEAELAALDDVEASDELAAEEAAEAEAAAGGLAEHGIDVLQDRPDAAEGFASLCCTITFPSIFNPHVRLSTLASEGCSIGTNIPSGALISYTVSHYYGTPGPFVGTTSGPLNNNSVKSVALTHSGSLDAMSCVAFAAW